MRGDPTGRAVRGGFGVAGAQKKHPPSYGNGDTDGLTLLCVKYSHLVTRALQGRGRLPEDNLSPTYHEEYFYTNKAFLFW